VEEGFNISRLAADGSIADPGWEQWEISEALSQLAMRDPGAGANEV
jgi:hypothetical protein